MNVAGKIVFLWDDPDGVAAAIAGALNPNPNSSLRKLEVPFELPLDKYGIEGVRASGKIIHFVDGNGVFQVPAWLLQSREAPTIVCAMNELLDQITGGVSTASSNGGATFLVAASKLKFQIESLASSNKHSGLYHVQIGPKTGASVLYAARIPRKPPPLLQIHYGPLSCFLQLTNALGLPTSVLIGQRSIGISSKALEEELQVLHETGDAVASSTVQGCVSLRNEIKWNTSKTWKEEEKPWRALYG
ncbi:PREDICTED: LOW QUALITY PROTEIN: uncharacterized protein LOC104822442 [Tarenaya hassleriana]|uniref:LOW QUALITY PROTEIN: uncharacterized protein LOC104822442 n=1 Tax=Tarenaya hassleriana TaxID=28532 RepID=UPI0008FD48F7|nr:PREDICTED: LOW QUALITY PROTEIN: uncharacterized protein LOC104822442 [Tarenaya hassleriana]